MYEDFFGLHRSPFNGVPAADETFESSAFLGAYHELYRAIERAESLILLGGESGAGKSTVLRRLETSLTAKLFTVIAVDAAAGAEGLVRTYQRIQGLVNPTGDGREVTRQPDQSAVGNQHLACRVVVLLDRADALPANILTQLHELLCPDRISASAVSVIVALPPRYEQQLTDAEAEALRSRMAQRVTLRSIDQAEVNSYITHKLELAGHRGAAIFTDEAICRIAKHGEGVLKRIDIVCGMALLIASEARQGTVDVSIVSEAIDDLEGPIELQPAHSKAAERQFNWPVTDWLNTRLGAITRQIGMAGAFVMHRTSRVVRSWHCVKQHIDCFGAYPFPIMRGRPSGPGHPAHGEKDWLGLKVGFVACQFVVFAFFIFLVSAATGERRIPDEDKKTMAIVEQQRQMQSQLQQKNKQLLASQNRIKEQQKGLKRLRQQVAASKAQQPAAPKALVLASQRVPVTPGSELPGPLGSARHEQAAAMSVPATAMVSMAEIPGNSSQRQRPLRKGRAQSNDASPAIRADHQSGAGDASSTSQGSRSGAVYEVVRGDTMYSTARRFGVTLVQLRKWNGLSDDRLSIGQKLQVRPALSVARATNSATRVATEATRVELNSSLLRAVRDNRLGAVKALLDQGANVEAKDNKGKTPLILAAGRGYLQMVQLLMQRAAKVDARDDAGRTALSFVAWNDHHDILLELLRQNAQIDIRTGDGWTPLMYASIAGHTRCVRTLLERGADVNATNGGARTALSGAVWNGHIEVAQLLLDEGANVNGRSDEGWTPLLEAAWNGRARLVQLLLDYGADPMIANASGQTPAAAASRRGHEDIASILSRTSIRPS